MEANKKIKLIVIKQREFAKTKWTVIKMLIYGVKSW